MASGTPQSTLSIRLSSLMPYFSFCLMQNHNAASTPSAMMIPYQ